MSVFVQVPVPLGTVVPIPRDVAPGFNDGQSIVDFKVTGYRIEEYADARGSRRNYEIEQTESYGSWIMPADTLEDAARRAGIEVHS